jgi:hypothetical protein
MAEQIHSKNRGSSIGPAFGLIAFGAYLLAGSYYGLTYAKWPFFMPPQLDIFGLLFGLFGEPVGGYAGGSLLGVLGLVLAIFGIAVLAKRNV